jgi:hypothetical protein
LNYRGYVVRDAPNVPGFVALLKAIPWSIEVNQYWANSFFLLTLACFLPGDSSTIRGLARNRISHFFSDARSASHICPTLSYEMVGFLNANLAHIVHRRANRSLGIWRCKLETLEIISPTRIVSHVTAAKHIKGQGHGIEKRQIEVDCVYWYPLQ